MTHSSMTSAVIYLILIIFVVSNNYANSQYLVPFDYTIATVDDVIFCISSGTCTCQQIIQGYLDRITRYNRAGPEIGSVISTHPNVLNEAAQLDLQFAQTRTLKGNLHCVPVLVKDNIDVAGIPTTNGMFAFLEQTPLIGADVVENMRRNGAIMIGKTNMSPFADKEAWVNSETGGLVRNPYGLGYTTYGSSGGSGASSAAMFSIINLGSETGVSVNLPSSASNSVGLRAPVTMLSQEGVMPNSKFQDVVGPIAKTARDVIIALDAMKSVPPFYSTGQTSVLRPDGLRGMRINVVSLMTYETFEVPGKGTFVADPNVITLFIRMIVNMQNLGAVVQNVTMDTGAALGAAGGMFAVEEGACTMQWRDNYFGNSTRFGADARFKSVQEVVAANELGFYQSTWERIVNQSSPQKCQEQTNAYMQARQNFIDNFMTPALANADLAIYPAMPVFPPILGNDAFNLEWGSNTAPPVNMILAGSWTAYPAMTIPMGFSAPQSGAPFGMPVGAYLITTPDKIDNMLMAAYAYQTSCGIRRTPWSTPTSASVSNIVPISQSTQAQQPVQNGCPVCQYSFTSYVNGAISYVGKMLK